MSNQKFAIRDIGGFSIIYSTTNETLIEKRFFDQINNYKINVTG
jgi:hypothetical protein